MNTILLNAKFTDFKNALTKLEEVISRKIKSDDIIIDATIQRFEFTYELAWKLMKAILEFNGISVNSPRNAVREAFKTNLIENADNWLSMLEDRNMTAQTYNEETANFIYDKICKIHFKTFTDFSQTAEKEIQS